MKLLSYFLLLVSLFLQTGCTSNEMFYGIQKGSQVQCLNEPNKAAYEECMKRTEGTYDEYQENRQDLSDTDDDDPRKCPGYF